MTASPLLPSVERFFTLSRRRASVESITLLNYRRQLETLIALAENAGLKTGSNAMPPRSVTWRYAAVVKDWVQPAWLYASPPYAASLTGW